MNRNLVTSSNISSIGYDSNDEILEIEFKDGSVYQYLQTPISEYDAIMNAKSHGQYLAQNVKGKYNFRKIR